ncbi:MAG: DNA-directed RNA polymerase subunit L [Candidatus Aenigmarchaeota archaeon]|nr:DNA-directed RNA polymerase subunit L [Candidatus Aenigmarchaeota archaeon]
MKIEKQDKETLIIEIVGSQHTLPNLLRKALWDDPSVSLAAYEKSHPYIGSPRLVVKASDPKKAVIDAVKRTKDEVNLFGSEFEKALKK